MRVVSLAMMCLLVIACTSHTQRPVVTDVQALTNGSIALRKCTLYVTTWAPPPLVFGPVFNELDLRDCKVETVKPVAPE